MRSCATARPLPTALQLPWAAEPLRCGTASTPRPLADRSYQRRRAALPDGDPAASLMREHEVGGIIEINDDIEEIETTAGNVC